MDATETRRAPYDLVLRDLDQDERCEVLLCAYGAQTVQLAQVDGSGGDLRIVEADDLGAGSPPADLAVGDMDGDGVLDLVVANAGWSSFSVLRGLGQR